MKVIFKGDTATLRKYLPVALSMWKKWLKTKPKYEVVKHVWLGAGLWFRFLKREIYMFAALSGWVYEGKIALLNYFFSDDDVLTSSTESTFRVAVKINGVFGGADRTTPTPADYDDIDVSADADLFGMYPVLSSYMTPTKICAARENVDLGVVRLFEFTRGATSWSTTYTDVSPGYLFDHYQLPASRVAIVYDGATTNVVYSCHDGVWINSGISFYAHGVADSYFVSPNGVTAVTTAETATTDCTISNWSAGVWNTIVTVAFTYTAAAVIPAISTDGRTVAISGNVSGVNQTRVYSSATGSWSLVVTVLLTGGGADISEDGRSFVVTNGTDYQIWSCVLGAWALVASGTSAVRGAPTVTTSGYAAFTSADGRTVMIHFTTGTSIWSCVSGAWALVVSTAVAPTNGFLKKLISADGRTAIVLAGSVGVYTYKAWSCISGAWIMVTTIDVPNPTNPETRILLSADGAVVVAKARSTNTANRWLTNFATSEADRGGTSTPAEALSYNAYSFTGVYEVLEGPYRVFGYPSGEFQLLTPEIFRWQPFTNQPTNITNVGTLCTMTNPTSNGLNDIGQKIRISGCTGASAAYNGDFFVKTYSATSVTFTNAALTTSLTLEGTPSASYGPANFGFSSLTGDGRTTAGHQYLLGSTMFGGTTELFITLYTHPD
jgi:hypothetical protein